MVPSNPECLEQLMQQITVNLEDNLLAFIDRYAEGVGLDRPEVYRVSYIQNLLRDYRTAKLNQEIRVALEADRENPEYQAEIALWDCVAGDGLDAEG
jgi:metal-responsive CopG/Arc/MetJ family transcriptional regulator